jgi:tetratricopeptide (TPR) repeat protein
LPAWLAASVFKLRNSALHSIEYPLESDDNDGASSGPVGVLLNQLKKVDATHDPEKAYSLHQAIGNIFRGSGTQSAEALRHFETARDMALKTADPDTQLLAHLDVAEAYIEQGRPGDSQHELAVASGALANHFTELVSRLDRGRGRGNFELGFTESALGYFEQAEQVAVSPEDKVRSACDAAMARTCLGQAEQTLEPLKKALQVLHGIRKAGPDGGMPTVVQNTLFADVHFHLAEAFHVLKNPDFAKAHYMKALHLEKTSPRKRAQRLSALKMGITMLEHGSAPELRCPTISKLPWHDKPQGPPKTTSDGGFMAKLDLLRAEGKFDLLESELKATLKDHRRPYKGLPAATALNMLGDLYRSQKKYSKAAKHFRPALQAAIACCGASNTEAKTAYEGLQEVKGELSSDGAGGYDERRVAEAAIQHYLDVVESGYGGEKQDSPEVETSSPAVISV